MSIALGVAGGVAIGVPVLGFVFAPLARETPGGGRGRERGERYKSGEPGGLVFVVAPPLPGGGVPWRAAACLRRVGENGFPASPATRPPRGPPARGLSAARLFMCPCHG